MSKKNILFLLVGSVLGLGLILLWLAYIPFDELIQYFSRISPPHVILASAIYLSAYFVRSVRWNILLSNTKKIPILDTWLYAMGGNLLNYMIPIRAGELVKAWFIKRNHGTAMGQNLPSIFIDKTFDTLAILCVILIIPFLAIKLSWGLIVLLALLTLVFVISVVIMLMASWNKGTLLSLLPKLFARLPDRFQRKLEGFIQNFVSGLNILEHSPQKLSLCVILTVFGVLLDGIYFYLLFVAFGIPFPFLKALFGYTLINLSYALPQPPAQLGSNEWMMIIIFSLGFGLTKSSASAIMAFAHVLTALLMTTVGLIAFAISGWDVLRMIFKGDFSKNG